MKERPILFSAHHGRALLDGTKTQTRRIFKPERMTWDANPWVWCVSFKRLEVTCEK